MKIEIGKHPNNVKFKDDSGAELKDLHVRSLTIECEVEQINTAFLEVVFIDATVDAVPNYIVGKHRNVRGIILEDGTLEYFPECKRNDLETNILKSHSITCADHKTLTMNFYEKHDRDQFLDAYTKLRMKIAREDKAAQAVS